MYTYVHNNPLKYIDPTGHWCQSKDGKYSHAGGCNDPSNKDNYVPDKLYYANKGRKYRDIIKIYNEEKKQAVGLSNEIGNIFLNITATNNSVALPGIRGGISTNGVRAIVAAIVGTAAVAGEASFSNIKREDLNYIFRKGRANKAKDMTPRPKDTDGLSFGRKSYLEKQVMTSMEMVNATGVLYAYQDPKNSNHILVRAVDPYEHELWIQSYANGTYDYYLTEVLQNIVIQLPGK
ncbi:hypothetical protein ACFOQM_11260 [Paenibacillus sp. GCM10012307]|uniref:Uncharacterized protein n=1 Tax=Paenibacillus roseus TaxID=2798579 RepID=A0A934IZ29_9BACL|nr:hypothetical protein [Paenibacillus roseus]MBJ6361862.1 hypothetical protein [Paenibacillus roseus]